MKNTKFLSLVLILLAIPVISFSQIPGRLNYQAVLRNAQSEVIPNTSIMVRFGVIAGTPSGTLLWEEEQNVTTDEFGMFSVIVGSGDKTGGTQANFSDISWADGLTYMKLSVSIGGVWSYFDPIPINSVPYSLISRTAADDADRDPENELIGSAVLSGSSLVITEGGNTHNVNLSSLIDSPFGINSDTVTLMNGSLSIGSETPGRSKLSVTSQDDSSLDALFEVRRSDGQTVFAVYNDGVRINIPIEPVTKGPRGGFAIGGFDRSKGEIVEDYMWVTPDSIRMYIDKTPEEIKGPRGGFAIGGFDRSKLGPKSDYFMLSADSTRFYIDDLSTKGPRGGFAIGGFDRSKGFRQDYMKVTVDSTRFFVRDSTAGFGISNVESGEAEGFLHMDKQNYFIGHQTGMKSRPEDGAVYNSFIGYKAGMNNTTGRKNVFLGFRAGETNNKGFLNVFLGNQSGLANTDGNQNIFIGEGSGMGSVSGDDNVFIGINSGQYNNNGTGNLFLGPQSGQYAWDTEGNIFIGYQAGALSTGSGNIFLGSSSGLYEGNSNRLIIENNPGYLYTPLVYGDFIGRTLHINGTLTANSTGKSSDIRLKNNIESLKDILPSILNLNPVSFQYDQDKADNFYLPDGLQYGLVAQELEEIFPALVKYDIWGYKTVDYTSLSVLLIPAIRELKAQLDEKEDEIAELSRRQADLEDRLIIMEQLLQNK